MIMGKDGSGDSHLFKRTNFMGIIVVIVENDFVKAS